MIYEIKNGVPREIISNREVPLTDGKVQQSTGKTKTSPSESDDDDEKGKNLIDLMDRFRG